MLRLLRKKLDKRKGRFYLQLLLLKMEPELFEEGPALFDSFKTQYRNGCHSPFLYIEACRLLEKDPALLVNMEPFEIHALYYGVTRWHVIGGAGPAGPRPWPLGRNFSTGFTTGFWRPFMRNIRRRRS